jgi:hypothetical protein
LLEVSNTNLFQIGTGLHPGVGRFRSREAADPKELAGRPKDFPSVRKWDTLSLRITVGFVQVIARREDYEDRIDASRLSNSRGDGWRERWYKKLPFFRRDGESSPKSN